MRLLQVCNKLPFPATDGGAIAMNNLTQGLIQAGVDVHVFALVTPKTLEASKTISDNYRQQTKLTAPFIDTGIKPLGALKNLFSSASYNLERFYSSEVETQIADLLKKESFDVIQLESIFVSPYIPVIRKYSKAKIVLRAHNIEHKIWERLALSASNPVKRWYLKTMSERLQMEELSVFDSVDAIATITHVDRDFILDIGFDKPIISVPFGLDVKRLESSVKATGDLFHLGAMDWLPNLEGINWLLGKVVPELEKKHIKYRLHLAGKKMPQEIFSRQSSVLKVEGVVQDGMEYMRDKSIMVVPLLSGGGMRVKIIEGMALGKTIVSTTIGAEGIECSDGENILLADTPSDFADAVARCINDQVLCRKLGENARKLAEERYDNSVITADLISFYSKLVV